SHSPISIVRGSSYANSQAIFSFLHDALPIFTYTATDTTDSNLVITQTAQVIFTAGAVSASVSTVSANPGSVTADGSTTSTITVTLLDAHSNAVSGKSVNLTAGGGSSQITVVSSSTDSNGHASFTVKDTTAETVTYTAKDTTDSNLTITQTAQVIFTAGAVSASVSTVSASPGSVTADGSTTSTITVTLLDAHSNPVNGKTVTLAQALTGGGTSHSTISTVSGTSGANGQASFTGKSTTA